MTRILMVCLGNICRSPMAEGVMRAVADEAFGDGRVSVDSAGTAGWHIGKSPDVRGQRAAMNRGIDITGQRARQLVPQDFYDFDHIFVMDSSNYKDALSLAPAGLDHKVELFLSYAPEQGTEVPDPYYGGDDGFDHVLDMVEDAAKGFLQKLKNDQA